MFSQLDIHVKCCVFSINVWIFVSDNNSVCCLLLYLDVDQRVAVSYTLVYCATSQYCGYLS